VDAYLITSPTGVLATLASVCAFFFWLEKSTQWRVFNYLPPLTFIYLVPLVLSNASISYLVPPVLSKLSPSYSGILTPKSPVYDAMQTFVLPMMLVLLLLNVNIRGVARILGRSVGVMLFGTLGVILGAPLGVLVVNHWLAEDAWEAYGALAGSWIGGTGNLAAVSRMLDASGTEVGLAVLADSLIYLLWLPILLVSKRFADPFARFTGVERDRILLERPEGAVVARPRCAPAMRDYLFLFSVALLVTWAADVMAGWLPLLEPYLSALTWQILLITTIAIFLSFTPLSEIPGSQELGMAFVFLFVARMGASAELAGVAEQAIPFVLGALVMIITHGLFCLLGAKLLRSDIHTAAIASAANIGGAASASIVASYHQPALVPAAILMALVGYAVGNYGGYLAALLCRLVM
jgi:uncharacterized membrane protein